jgi:hypothetical protein
MDFALNEESQPDCRPRNQAALKFLRWKDGAISAANDSFTYSQKS